MRTPLPIQVVLIFDAAKSQRSFGEQKFEARTITPECIFFSVKLQRARIHKYK